MAPPAVGDGQPGVGGDEEAAHAQDLQVRLQGVGEQAAPGASRTR